MVLAASDFYYYRLATPGRRKHTAKASDKLSGNEILARILEVAGPNVVAEGAAAHILIVGTNLLPSERHSAGRPALYGS